MNTFWRTGCAILIALCVHSGSVAAQSLGECRQIDDSLERFECYESLEADTATPRQRDPRDEPAVDPAGGEETPDPTPATRPEDAASHQDFGRRSSTRLVERGGRTEMHGVVSEVEELLPNMRLITLDGGERWRQMVSRPYLLTEGDEVRIYGTRWGSAHRLSASRLGGFIQVERVD